MPRQSLVSGLWQTQRPKLAASVLIAVMATLLFLFFDADWFYVFDFEIAGAQNLTPAEIQKASGVLGYNIFFIDAPAVERALAKLPEVKSVHVSTRMPNQMAVVIEERVPEVTWQRGAETYWVTTDSTVLRARTNLTQLPTLRDLDQAAVKLGERAPKPALAAFRALREAWQDGPRAFEWSAARGLAFTDAHGWKVYLGGADDMPGKVAQVRALIQQLAAQKAKIQFIDAGKGDPYYQ